MQSLDFTATVLDIKGRLIVRLPSDISKQLSSRGQVASVIRVNRYEQVNVLEPDGDWGHWLNLTAEMNLKAGDTGDFTITPTKAWPEVVVPKDFSKALATAPQNVQDKWADITAMARWEWVRWIKATRNPDTRQIRIEKSISKLNGKHRRPCCFNLAACTDMELEKNGRLIEVTD